LPKNRSNLYCLLDRAGIKFQTTGTVTNHILIPFAGENAVTLPQIVAFYSDALAFFFMKFKSRFFIGDFYDYLVSIKELRGERSRTTYGIKSGPNAAHTLWYVFSN